MKYLKKKLLYLCLSIGLFACNNKPIFDTYESGGDTVKHQPSHKKESKIVKSNNYNVEQDEYINNILNKKPLFIKTKYNHTIIRYDEIQIDVYYYKTIPYEQLERWDLFCNDKHGNTIMIQSYCGKVKHSIAPSTIERIKGMCNTKSLDK